jgi:hypothetical protein
MVAPMMSGLRQSFEVASTGARPGEAIVPTKGEFLKAPPNQVVHRNLRDGAIIRLDTGEHWQEPTCADIHRRQTQLGNGTGNPAVLNSGNNPVAAP